jgi:hypothetical protein
LYAAQEVEDMVAILAEGFHAWAYVSPHMTVAMHITSVETAAHRHGEEGATEQQRLDQTRATRLQALLNVPLRRRYSPALDAFVALNGPDDILLRSPNGILKPIDSNLWMGPRST